MKKIYLILVMVFGLMAVNTKAQMSSYVFTPGTATFTPITGGTAVSTTTSVADFLGDTKTSISIPLGFSFKFNGVNYSSVIAMSDGFISFNPLATTVVTNNLATSTANSRPLVAPLWDDLDGASGTGAANYITEGAMGSRIFTIEWLNWQWNYLATGATISFQVKLYEGSNAIEFIYQQESGAVNSASASIGIAAIGTGSGNFISLNNSTAAPTPSITTETTGINLKPATGQVYRFEPNPVTVVMDYVNLQFPQTATIALGGSETIYTQGYEPGVTEAAGAGTGVQAWIGINGSNTDPATWTTWVPATFNVQVGNNDEFQAAIGSTLGAGTYYYASRWQLNTGEYRYGGYPNGYWNGTTQTSGVLTVTPTVANDICSGAISLTVNADLACAVTTAGTTVGATQSPDLPAPTCSATGINDDVWFSFVATGASHVITITGATNTTASQVYSGTCGSFTAVACASTSSGTLNQTVTGLVSGNTYYTRVYSTATALATTSNFTICVGTPPLPPANDECAAAVVLTANPDLTCTIPTAGTTLSATQSTGTAPTCSATGINDDVWYSFIATGTSHLISITAATNTTAAQVYSGTCGALVAVACGSTTSGTLNLNASGLLNGDTYYVRVYTTSTVVGTSSNFNICILTPPPPPANDNICGAVSLSVSGNPTCTTSLTGQSTQYSTQSLAGCVGTADEDIWYSFVATNTTHIITLTSSGSGSTDRVHQLFSSSDNTCNGTLTSLICSDPETSTVNGLTIGNTYFLRVYSYSSGNFATFDICITTPLPPPANDNVCGAVSLSVSGNPTCTTSLTGQSTQYSTQSLAGCLGTADEDIWYSFVATSTSHIITLTNSGTGSTDRVHQLFSSSDNTCNGTLTSLNCSDPETSTVIGLTIGNTYFLRVYSYSTGNYATFDLCITSLAPPPANDDAPGAITLTVGGTCTGGTYSNASATLGTTEPRISCKGSLTAGSMVWFKFVAPPSGFVKVTTDISGGTLTDTRIALFSATDVNDYSTFTILACDDDNGSVVGANSIFYANGLLPSNTYYIAVDHWNGSSTGTFCVEVKEFNSTMLSTATSCTAGQDLSSYRDNYTGWLSVTDNTGNLRALLRNPAGTGTSTYTFNNSMTINTGAVRQSSQTGTYYLDRNFRIANSAATNIDVQLFFLATETAALTAADGTSLASLAVTRQTEVVAGCHPNFVAGNGVTSVIPQNTNGTLSGVDWIQFNTPAFSNFYLNKVGVVLPVSVEYFKGSKQSNGHLLDWKVTCYNSPSVTMLLERSSDGRKFTSINNQTETSLRCLQPFSFTDAAPLAGINYYRLKSIDIDGKESYSKIVALLNKDKGFEIVSLVPNPVKDEAVLSVSSATKSIIEIVVSDLSGKQLNKQRVSMIAGNNLLPINVRNLPAGTYQVTGITADGMTRTLRFVKQ